MMACKKCNHNESEVKYEETWASDCPFFGLFQEDKFVGGKLWHTCKRCGYKWSTDCKDKDLNQLTDK